MYSLVIQNATVIDGLGNPPFVADVAVENGKIAAIGQGLSAASSIDASGLTLTPGFIDSHSHSDRTALRFPDQKEKVEQGITFSITGQCGGSETPKRNKTTGMIEPPAQYFARVKEVPQGSHSAMLIGHGSLRDAVMGKERRAPTAAELEEMKALLEEGLRAGSIGLSFGLYYAPGAYAESDEMVALAEVVAKHGGILAAHLRDEGDRLIESVEEFLSVIRRSGCRAVFSHHKAAKAPNHGKIVQSLKLIDEAVKEGADVYLDVYPYNASGTGLASRFVPASIHPEGSSGVLSLLDDPAFCAYAKQEMQRQLGTDYSFTLVTKYPSRREYEGMTISEIAKARGETDQYDTVLNLLREGNGIGAAVYFNISEADIRRVMAHPRAMICTDSAARGDAEKHHPRLVGSFPRVLAKYVREEGIVPLPEMIRRMTSLPAHVYGLHGKGSVCVGMDADLCIFDAERITDCADYVNCSRPNEGLYYVLIDGKIVLENGSYNGTRAARVRTAL